MFARVISHRFKAGLDQIDSFVAVHRRISIQTFEVELRLESDNVEYHVVYDEYLSITLLFNGVQLKRVYLKDILISSKWSLHMY